jgi:hypothetical protein
MIVLGDLMPPGFVTPDPPLPMPKRVRSQSHTDYEGAMSQWALAANGPRGGNAYTQFGDAGGDVKVWLDRATGGALSSADTKLEQAKWLLITAAAMSTFAVILQLRR